MTIGKFLMAAFVAGLSGVADAFLVNFIAPEKFNMAHFDLMAGVCLFFFVKAFFFWIKEHQKEFMMVFLAASIGVTATACSLKQKEVATKADATVYSILSSVQAGADRLAASGAISAETRRALAPHLLKALQLGDDFNRSVRAGSVFEAIPALLDALRVLKVQLGQLIPASIGGSLVADIDRAIGLVPAGGQ